jgi:outer membrane immunogenic protein
MLRTGFLTAVGVALLCSPSVAADLIMDDMADAVAMSSDTDWTGFYAGIHGGIGSASAGFDVEYLGGIYPLGTVADDASSSEGLFGVQVGYNWDAGDFVFGVQGDVSAGLGGDVEEFGPGDLDDPSFEDDTGGFHYQGEITPSLEWLATFTGRIGLDTGAMLPYLTAGLAVANTSTTVAYAADIGFYDEYDLDDETRVGFVVGAGAQFAITESISLFAEYNYVGLGGDDPDSFVIDDGTHGGIEVSPEGINDIHVVKAGLNFSF